MTRETLSNLISTHQTEIFRYLKYLGADHAAAEDLLQDAFLRAFRAESAPDMEDITSRGAWLRRIARNLFYDHCRRASRSPISFDSARAEHAEEFWTHDFLIQDDGFGCLEALECCLGSLPERQRKMVHSFYANRQSREQIAEDFGITTDGVKVALRRIRQALGECIQTRLATP